MSIEKFKDLSISQAYHAADDFMKLLAKELDMKLLPHLHISANFSGSCYVSQLNLIALDTVQISYFRWSPLIVLAHEMLHAYQRYQGWLGESEYLSTKWKGKWIQWTSFPHHQLPWEVDAIQYERKIAKRLDVDPIYRPQLEKESLESWFEHIQQSA